MNINFMGRGARANQEDSQYDVYEADAERLYDSFSDLYDDFDEGRSKTPFVIIGALLAVAIVGGGLAYAYKHGSGDGGDGVAIIPAERTPTKVELADPGGVDIPHQGRQVFDEVAGQSGAGERVGAGDDQPAPDAPAATDIAGLIDETAPIALPAPQREAGRAGFAPTGANGAPAANGATDGAGDAGADGALTIGALASRVTRATPGPLVPDGETASAAPGLEIDQTSDPTAQPVVPAAQPVPAAPTPASGTAAERLPLQPASPETGVFEPRRVPTVTIGADGTVVSETVPAPAGLERAASQARELAPLVSPNAAAETVVAGQAPAVPAEPAAASPVADALRAGAERLNPPARPDAQTSLFAPSPRPKPRPTTRLAATEPAGAVRPQIPASATNAAAARAAEGFAVQVASHRKQAEAVAAFADLQQRYPSLISGYQPLIQRADLGERGVFYRLRIGPVATKNDANRLCASLKSAGLPGCLVRAL